jgi:Polyketide cyclase / dehydrase and lipid transport
MPHIEESIDIAVARSDLFRFCHDIANWPDWDEQVVHVELLTPRPIRRGTLLRVDSSYAGGTVFSWDAEVIDYQLPQGSRVRVIDAASSSPFGPGSELRWEFSTLDGRTRFTWIWKYESSGFIARIADMLGRRAMTHRAIKRSLANLKVMVEERGAT